MPQEQEPKKDVAEEREALKEKIREATRQIEMALYDIHNAAFEPSKYPDKEVGQAAIEAFKKVQHWVNGRLKSLEEGSTHIE